MAREREFNAANTRLNAEYLVNVLRSFLMTKNASEHAKLVPVLCSLLHFGQEETRVITDRWAYSGGGLVSWLLPAMPPPMPPSVLSRAAGSDASSEDAPKKTVPNRIDIYGSGVNWS